jgi:hypothetical protein
LGKMKTQDCCDWICHSHLNPIGKTFSNTKPKKVTQPSSLHEKKKEKFSRQP